MLIAHQLEIKGAPTLIRAMKQLEAAGHTDIHLLLVGSSKRNGRVERMINASGLAGRITQVGSVPDTKPFYAACDIYTHPTLFDACGLVVLEAMACGLPVISSPIAGSHELIAPNESGFIMPDPQDAGYLAETVLQLRDRQIREKIGRAARTAIENQTVDRCYQQYIDIYEEIAQRKHA